MEERVNEDQVEIVKVDRVLTVDACVAGPERDLTGLWVDQPPVLIVALVDQGGCDLFNVDSVEVQHRISV